jgi:hypothetical protein
MSLPEAEREATALYYVDGYSQADVAGFLGVPVSTVNSRLHAARGHLRERMTTMAQDMLKNNALGEDFAHRLLAFPFPRIEPEVEVTDMPGENMTVRCADAQVFFTPLEEGGRCDWCFYDWPDWRLTGINETRVVDWTREKGRAACRIWTKYTPLPDGEPEWMDDHVLVEADSWRKVTLKRYAPGQVFMGTYRWPNDPQDYAAPPQPMTLSVGAKWAEGEVTGVAGVRIGERFWRCLKIVTGAQQWKTGTSTPAVFAEWYVAENGRTVFFQRYNGKGFREAPKPGSYEALAGSAELEFHGAEFRHWYDCIADFALEDIFGQSLQE